MGPLGILGGGQLGRMTLQAASRLGIDVVIAERFPNSPAARLTPYSVVFETGWNDPRALDQLASLAHVLTLENEFVDSHVLVALEATRQFRSTSHPTLWASDPVSRKRDDSATTARIAR